MASDIVTATTRRPPPSAGEEKAAAGEARSAPARARESAPALRAAQPRLSPLTKRILAVNGLALALLGAGFLYLGAYRENLIAQSLDSLTTQARIFAAALGEEVRLDSRGRVQGIDENLTREMMRRLVEPAKVRARLFDPKGMLIADTQVLLGPGGAVEVTELPEPTRGFWERVADAIYAFVVDYVPGRTSYPLYVAPEGDNAAFFPAVEKALVGEIGRNVQSTRSGGLVLTVAAPVQHYREVLGAVQLTMSGRAIDTAVRSIRFEVIKVFVVAFMVTVLLSLYLAGTIARPIRRLAAAARAVRRRPSQATAAAIPDLTRRGDEIGELSAALREMTDALWQRFGAIERFAADVAHEIKNPLTSLKSAIETALRLEDPEKRRQLLQLVLEDVARLDRLISDISDASRLDAELNRDEMATVPLGRLLAALVQMQEASSQPGGPRILLELPGTAGTRAGDLPVPGVEGRLVQVFRNLITNALSFSPPEGAIRIKAGREAGFAVVSVEDDGPGIPEGKQQAIFERFYSERPAGEKFGLHSGLGLSISKQIVESHKGRIWAENRRDAAGRAVGARFTVRLPAA